MLNKQSLQKFKQLYFKNYRIKLNDKEALQKALRVLNLVRIVRGKSQL
jgi:hypothetical protein